MCLVGGAADVFKISIGGDCSRRYDTRGNRGHDVDRQVVRDEMGQAKQTFHRLLDSATVVDLSRPSNGTKWTNG